MTTVSFTGKRTGLNQTERDMIRLVLFAICPETSFHNDGEGADQHFQRVCEALRLPTAINDKDADVGAMARNRSLVGLCDTLIACPPSRNILKKGSGTWETIKYGWKYGKSVIIVHEDGEIFDCPTKDKYKELTKTYGW